MARLTASQPLLQPHVGVFRRYDDERWDQTPIKIGAVDLTDPGGRRRTVHAFDVHHVAAARLRALRAAAVTVTGQAAVLRPPAADAPRLDAARLGLDSGWAEPDGTVGGGPVTADRRGGGGAAAAGAGRGAGAVRRGQPCPRRGADPCQQRHGGDLAEAVRCGLASALAYRALRAVVEGRSAARQVRLDTRGADPELVFLSKSAANLGIAVELLDLSGAAEGGLSVLLARYPDQTDGRWRYAVAGDPVHAVAAGAALRDVLGQAALRAQDPAITPDTGDALLDEFDAGTLAVGDPAPADGAALSWSQVRQGLRERGHDVLVASVGGADLAAGGLVAVKVLLTAQEGR